MDIGGWNWEIEPAKVGLSGDEYPEGSMAVMGGRHNNQCF